ncbi:hypothetical protein D083_1134 [Dickeya solani RNS 08.23.3.1.A]|nr:hypothetical protein D083_1134 [Dickeya solani RNS 08.23.3.1.A]
MPHYCPICGAEMQKKTEVIDGEIVEVWACEECGFEEPA